ncbi:MAG: polysaccharide biosynthesis C-terminal domain-containing protein [Chloroflexi bacterium]|nr:polysaccharide biosynthesis C-terminal domain-containing protein [Chloroflexota bacterium]
MSLATALLRFVVGMAASIMVARLLGPEGKGEYALLVLVAAMLFNLGNLSIGNSIVYYVGGGKDRLEDIAAAALTAALALSVATMVSFVLLLAFLGQAILPGLTPWLLLAMAFLVPVRFVTFYYQQFMVATHRVPQYSVTVVVGLLGYFSLLVMLLLIVPLGVVGAVVATAGGDVAALGASLWLATRGVPWRLSFPGKLVWRFLVFGAKNHAAVLTSYLGYRLDMFLVNLFLGVLFVGYYSVGVGVAEMLLFLAASVEMVLLPRTSSLSWQESSRMVPVVARNTIFLSALGAVGLLVLSPWLVPFLYGSVFAPSVFPLLILLPGIVLRGGDKILSVYIVGRGRPLICTLAATANLVSNIGLNLFLIPRWGLGGAALASTVSYSVSFIIVLSIFLKMSRADLWQSIIIRGEDFALYRRTSLQIGSRLMAAAPWHVPEGTN